MKFWKAKLKNNQWTDENKEKWDDIKNDVICLQLCLDDRTITLPENADSYIQGKTASANMLTGEMCIESRFLGYVLGNIIVKIRVNELTNNITIENR